MRTALLLVLSLVVGLGAWAQDVGPAELGDAKTLPQTFEFENERPGEAPSGWSGGPKGTVQTDDRVAHSGSSSARLERTEGAPSTFSSMHRAVAVTFGGRRVTLRGFVRTQDVDGFAGLWLREDDADGESVAFDNMQARNVKGTSEWTEYAITLPLKPESEKLFFGALLAGTGRAWVDDLQVLVDDKPVREAPRKPARLLTALENDHEFDGGSRLSIESLSQAQIENLTTLGEVWGFLKYRHPAVTSGRKHWDYALLRVLPEVLASPDRAAGNAAILRWINELGALRPCSKCARLDERDLHLRPPIAWIDDATVLGPALSAKLRAIEANRSAGGEQFYVALAEGVGNPVFKHEKLYGKVSFPDPGFQLLSLFRFWNVVEYWSPNRDVIGEDWHRVLAEFVPRVTLAKDANDYTLQLLALTARLHDGHTWLRSPVSALPPTGDCAFQLKFRFVQDRPVITQIGKGIAKLRVGDVVTHIDGEPVAKLLDAWRPYYSASNDWAQAYSFATYLGWGQCGDASLRVERAEEPISIARTKETHSSFQQWHDLPGDTFRLLSKDVAYLKLSSVNAASAGAYVERAAGTKGLIVDIRNYPSEFVVFALGSLLVEKPTPFARFTTGDLDHPGAFHWNEPVMIEPAAPHFSGKVVVLVDEVSHSQAEYTAMAFRATPGAVVVGSPTSGADGNVSSIALPGEHRTQISGIGVFYPDKRPTQRVGIIPDVAVAPTIRGIADRRDEVLEEAVRQILGAGASEDDVRRIARPDG